MANELTVSILNKMITQDNVKTKFEEVLGKKSGQFLTSIVNATRGNTKLQECDAGSIISAGLVAATCDLPIDSNLGFAAIVPYGNKAQFQMMYKGFVQLAIRSGQYRDINVSEVYEDELVSYNPITGKLQFAEDFEKCTQRAEGKRENVIGYYANFSLLTGYSKGLYMTKAEVENHAKQYSAAYQNDIKKGWTSSYWSKDFDSMAKKTVLKLLLSKWGVLSIEMQKAIIDDQKVYEDEDKESYADNHKVLDDIPDPLNANKKDEPIDVPAEDVSEEVKKEAEEQFK